MTNGWNRKLWGVEEYGGRKEPLILGKAWHVVKAGDYSGEPTRCLLFTTRKLARLWCIEMATKSANWSGYWRFRPVRVRETVRPI